ncbi:MAG: NADH-ubiquinone oxidoreductase chain J, partial [uncultured Nocardioides sp.]
GVLDPGPADGGRRARHPVRAQGGARGPPAGRRDDQPGRALPRPRGAVPVRRADHRLHRRHLDALPLRDDAHRRRHHRLGRRDDPRAARPRGAPRPAAGRRPRDRAGPGHPRHGGRSRGGQRGRERPEPRQHPLLPLRLRVRGDQRPADHRRPGRDGAGAPRAPVREAHPGLDGGAADARLRRARQAPRAAALTRCLRPSQRGRHARAPARRQHV